MMNTKSTYCNQPEIDPNIRTAIVYSIDHLFAYIVKITHGDKSYYISNKDGPIKFDNMEDATKAAVDENAQQAYLALSKTSEETDLSTCHANHQDRYDYSPIALK